MPLVIPEGVTPRLKTDATPEQLLKSLVLSPLIYLRVVGIVSFWGLVHLCSRAKLELKAIGLGGGGIALYCLSLCVKLRRYCDGISTVIIFHLSSYFLVASSS